VQPSRSSFTQMQSRAVGSKLAVQGADEDQPGMFKRVIIRISRRPSAPKRISSFDSVLDSNELSGSPLFESANFFGSWLEIDTDDDDSDFLDVKSYSYLAMLENNFMKDYLCCNQTLDSLHDLLWHYEIHHAQQP
jgi:hypothetical protein